MILKASANNLLLTEDLISEQDKTDKTDGKVLERPILAAEAIGTMTTQGAALKHIILREMTIVARALVDTSRIVAVTVADKASELVETIAVVKAAAVMRATADTMIVEATTIEVAGVMMTDTMESVKTAIEIAALLLVAVTLVEIDLAICAIKTKVNMKDVMIPIEEMEAASAKAKGNVRTFRPPMT